MTGDPLRRLWQEASRGDYASMARWARALYGSGLGIRAVIRTCYGVDFPEEFFVIAESGAWQRRLWVLFTDQPWELTVPLDRGGPLPEGDLEGRERKIFARDPDLVPLVYLWTGGYDQMVGCYRLTELAAGRSTMFGVPRRAEPRDEIVCYDDYDSLLAVLHAHHVDYLQQMEWILDQPWNFGFGALDQRAVDQSRLLVGKVEALQREVSSRDSG